MLRKASIVTFGGSSVVGLRGWYTPACWRACRQPPTTLYPLFCREYEPGEKLKLIISDIISYLERKRGQYAVYSIAVPSMAGI